jgi:LmbE family N-acetylglucosaminyl deacetylase
MTHPEFRRHGILTALGERANDVCASAGAPFQIGFHYGGWDFEQLNDPMLLLLQQISPDVIYAPSRVDFHPEHHWVAHSLARLLREAGKLMASAALRVYQLQVPLTPVLSNRIVDCSDVCGAVATAMSAYTTQSVNISRALRMRRYSAKSFGFKEQGEEFWQMSVSSYCRLHADTPDGWDVACFRGMRYRSFSDPLAFGLGLKERRRLAREVEALDGTKREG